MPKVPDRDPRPESFDTRVKVLQRLAKRARLQARLISTYGFGGTVAGVIGFVYLLLEDGFDEAAGLLLFFLVLQTGVLSLIVFAARRRASAFRRLKRSGGLVELESELPASVKRVFDRALVSMKADAGQYRLFVLLKPSTTPSISRDEAGRFGLILPLGFIKSCSSDPSAAAAMLAHEIAHSINGDTELWILSDSLAHGVKVVFVPFFCILFLIFAVAYCAAPEGLALNSTVSLWLSFLIARYPDRVAKSRQLGEELADEAVVRAGFGPDLKRAVAERLQETESERVHERLQHNPDDEVHPARWWRLRRIDEMMEELVEEVIAELETRLPSGDGSSGDPQSFPAGASAFAEGSLDTGIGHQTFRGR